MKNSIILAFFLSFYASLALGQTIDCQWLMIDGKGKTGCNTAGVNTYSATPLNTPNVQLDGVLQPALATPQMARNDIFVIYDDGTYFNSRDYNATNYNPNFFLPAAGTTPASSHKLQGSRNIISMYLTNVYEGDDPPPGVRATGWSAGTASITFPNSTPIQSMTANHDIVMNKDITLIINNSSAAGLANDDTLFTNKIISGTGTPVVNNFFTVSRAFSSGTQYSNNTNLQDLGNGKIVLKNITANTPPYIFVNLRPTTALGTYVNNARANFSIKHRNQTMPFSLLEESVRAAHDPNYMQVLSTCQKSSDEKYVYYHIEFENTGSEEAEKVKIELHLQDYFHKRCIKDAQFFVGGVAVEGKVHRWFRHVWFEFDKDILVKTCAADPEHCSGYVEFCIKISAEKDLRSLGTNLQLENASVNFNHESYPLEMFEDLDMVENPDDPNGNSFRIAPDTTCSCSCNK